MVNYTWLMLIMVVVFDNNVWAQGDSNDPPQTPMPEGSDNVVTHKPSEDPSLSTGLTDGNTKKQGSHGPPNTKEQPAETSRFISHGYKILPIHERFRIMCYYLLSRDVRSMAQLFDDYKRAVDDKEDGCRNIEYDSVVATGLCMMMIVGFVVILHYCCMFHHNNSIRNRPKIQRPKIDVPQPRLLNVRHRDSLSTTPYADQSMPTRQYSAQWTKHTYSAQFSFRPYQTNVFNGQKLN